MGAVDLGDEFAFEGGAGGEFFEEVVEAGIVVGLFAGADVVGGGVEAEGDAVFG